MYETLYVDEIEEEISVNISLVDCQVFRMCLKILLKSVLVISKIYANEN